MNDIDKESNSYSEVIKDGIKSWSETTQDIIQGTQSFMRTLLEPVFREHVLPLARDWIRGKEVDIRAWINIAGGSHHYINVKSVDGALLFTVPGPYCDVDPTSNFDDNGNLVENPHFMLDYQERMRADGNVREQTRIDDKITRNLSVQTPAQRKSNHLLGFYPMWLYYDLPMEELFGPNHAQIVEQINRIAKDVAPEEVKEEAPVKTETELVITEGGAEDEHFVY